jgi:ABC-type multidrug transport system ATPase subunit
MSPHDQPGRAPAVRASELTQCYGARPVLEDLTFILHPGVTGLIGVNGAGKSTLIRLLATSLVASAGSLELFGQPADHGVVGARRRIGYMPQSLELPKSLTVQDFLGYMAWLRGFPRRARPGLVEEALSATDLSDRAREKVGALSGGMHRRLLLAQALLGDPELLLLDEPTAGLDPEQRIRVRRLVDGAALARTTVVSSHLMSDLVGLADRILMLDEGRVVFDGTVDELGALGSAVMGAGADLSTHEAAFLRLRSARGE